MDRLFEVHRNHGFCSQDSSFSFELFGYFIVSRSVYSFDFNEIIVKCCTDILFDGDSYLKNIMITVRYNLSIGQKS